MKRILSLFIIFVTFSSFSTAEHETYLSVTEINYNQENTSFQIISRVFIDDLENVLARRYQQDVVLSYENDLDEHAGLISRYLDKKLNITVNGEHKKLNYLGSKFDADQVVLFIEVLNVEQPQQVKVENLILTDLFDSQKNIVHVKKGDQIESMLLVKENGSKTVNF